MITDKEHTFSYQQDLGQVAAAYEGEGVDGVANGGQYDRGPLASGNESGPWCMGEPLYFYWICTESFLSAGAATLRIQLLSDAVENGQDGSSVMHYDSGLLDAATAGSPLQAGAKWFEALNPKGIDQTTLLAADWERYVNVVFTIGTATTTAGQITSGFTRNVSLIHAYASGLGISQGVAS